jgi:L-ascorbate metabolism protein UlaG (beta-lactamase superfamily)
VSAVQLTKYAHACVRVEKPGGVLVLDPGEWAEPEALADASAVLVTHEHFDHLDAPKIKAAQDARPDLAVYGTPDAVEILRKAGVAAEAVEPGDEFTAAGFAVTAVGGLHAEIHGGLPGCANLGFILDGALYHPGDALFVPDRPVRTLLLPVSGPWIKLGEAIDFLAAVAPERAFAVHDGLLSPAGLAVADRWIGGRAPAGSSYARLTPGQTAELMEE